MRIETVKLENLIPAEYNPRIDLQPGDPEYEKLKRSIEEFGLVEPIVWNQRTGKVVGGHQRLKILQDLGVAETDVVIVDLDETREKALNLALNKIEGEIEKLMTDFSLSPARMRSGMTTSTRMRRSRTSWCQTHAAA
ncbi:ParB N-terminal domain-containing protein [Alicyclobacillus suci]|uniref:ParB N-terminal domain-containing protein n=1 Tax=Alicyclobacillus suci TaxID=2816080 RepID=UPI001A8DE24C|nr:ParB N-terminal domain-containing protein [Alicyclobacillus suci]